MVDLAKLQNVLNTNADDIKGKEPLPVGTFTYLIGSSKFDESSQKKTPCIVFAGQPQRALEDVDAQLMTGVNLSERTPDEFTFYLTEKALIMLKEFVAACGQPVQGVTVQQMIDSVAGKLVNVYVIQKPNTRDPSKAHNEFGPFSLVE